MARLPLADPVAQLDGSRYESVNCGPAAGAMMSRHASGNRVAPTPSQVRARGDMGTGPTSFAMVKRGVDGFAPEFNAIGLAGPTMIRLGYIDLPTFRMSLVLRSRLHQIALRYSVIAAEPEYRGDDYQGGHFVCARMLFRKLADGTFRRVYPTDLPTMRDATLANLWTEVLDPLADGRWSGDLKARVPQAPQKWPLSLLFKAGDAFSDPGAPDGKLSVATIGRAPRL